MPGIARSHDGSGERQRAGPRGDGEPGRDCFRRVGSRVGLARSGSAWLRGKKNKKRHEAGLKSVSFSKTKELFHLF